MNKKYQSYNILNIHKTPQFKNLPETVQFEIKVVAQIFPFKTNNYVMDELIDWSDPFNDPIFNLTFPNKLMLLPEYYQQMENVVNAGDKQAIKALANEIRLQLNPHPAGQMEHNTPMLQGEALKGMQHKYRETILFFPSQGQTCHAYCSFCFRWPQFVGMNDLKFATKEVNSLIEYVSQHPEISDILFTGGDPLIMKTRILKAYLDAILAADLPNIKTIRIGTKALGFWPYRFTSDSDANELLELFTNIVDSGKQLAFMAHFNHPQELKTPTVQEAIKRIRKTGAQIRTQSPLLAHINDKAEIWAEMWKQQVQLGLIPYYMFVIRDTGAQHYFGVPLSKASDIFRQAYQNVTGLARTVRGPSMSTTNGKIQILGVSEINQEKLFVLQFLQARNPELVGMPFFAKYDPYASWLDELEVLDDAGFFFEKTEELLNVDLA